MKESTGSFVVSLKKALNGIPPPSWGRQVMDTSNLPVVMAQSDERLVKQSASTYTWTKALFDFTIMMKRLHEETKKFRNFPQVLN